MPMRSEGGDVLSLTSNVLPDAHEDQLQVGWRMVQSAFTGKVAAMEQELRNLKVSCEEQKGQAGSLQRKNSSLEAELQESNQRGGQLADENKELFKTVQQLRRQLMKLEGLKKKVLDSVTDEQFDHEDARHYMRQEAAALPATAASLQSDGRGVGAGAWPSSASLDTGRATAGVEQTSSPRLRSAWSTPAPAPGSQTSPGGEEAIASAVVDGKQFFRQARTSLSYEAFNEFLANIKQLNNQQQSREETLEQARRIFGPELQHLYREFEQLLNRHGA